MNRRTLAARAAASVVLAGALLAGTAGCTFVTPQATLNKYDPSDGVGITVGTVDVRNAVALVSKDGRAYSLLVTLVNNGTAPASVTLQYESSGNKASIVKAVTPHSALSFGNTVDEEQIIILNPGAPAGALYPVYVQSGKAPGKEMLVPVLNGSLPQYKDLLPPDVQR